MIHSDGHPSKSTGSDSTETNSFLEAVPSLWRQLREGSEWAHQLGEILVCGALTCGELSSAAQVSLLLTVNTGGPLRVSDDSFARYVGDLDLSSLAVGLRFLPRKLTEEGDDTGKQACSFTEHSAPRIFHKLLELEEKTA